MAGRTITLPFGAKKVDLDLPDAWNLLGVCEPAGCDALADPAAACAAALAAPIGAPPLVELARGKKKVAIVVEDVSRPAPVHLFSGPVARALAEAGVPDEAVTVVTALGVHAAMTEEETAKKFGAEVLARFRWVNHDPNPGDHLAYLGATKRGTPVWINRLAAEAELVVTLGCVEPHIIACFGGGAKMIVPGVAGGPTIAANHALNTRPGSFNHVGLDPERNPMRLDLEEAAAMLAPPLFVVNAVLRGDQSIARIVAGHPVQAHREGCRTAAAIFGAPVPRQADVVVTSSHPMALDFRQGGKGLANTIRALKKGGTMLCLMPCEAGWGAVSMPKKKVRFGKRGMRLLSSILLPLIRRRTFGMKEEDRFFAYFALQTVRYYNAIFYAPTLPPEISERLRFLEIHHDLSAAVASALKAVPRGDVLVFPQGGVTYPVLP
jgi:nickel-dependent lactate racemase